MTPPEPFLVDGPLPTGRITLIEASAGTGKTYALAALAVRFVAEHDVPIGRVLIVTFMRAATAELRDRIRRRLIEAEQHLALPRPGPGEEPDDLVLAALDRCDDPDRALRRDRLTRAVSEFDAATISTIHGYCAQVRTSLGVLSGENIDAVPAASEGELIRDVCADLYFEALARSDDDPVGGRKLNDLVKLVQSARTLTGSVIQAESGQEVDINTVELVKRAVTEVDARLRRTGSLTFDSLVSSVGQAIRDDQALQTELRGQFDVALIDEFQDTDPVQWEIFDTLFGSGAASARNGDRDRSLSLVLVGDPKQAIYAFRGGDVYTYLAASETAHLMALTTNHRSDPTTLAAMNAIGEGQVFGDPSIAYQHVDPSPRNAARRAIDQHGTSLPGLAVRALLTDPDHEGKLPKADDARRIISDDLAGVAHELLQGEVEEPGEEPRKVRPGDIAVLVGSTTDAHPVTKALRRAGIPSVLRLRDDVADSPARHQWRVLLNAMDRPASLDRAAAAAVSWFFGWDPKDLAAALSPPDDGATEHTEALAGLQHQLTEWDQVLTDKGIAAVFGEARRSNRLVERLLSRPTGERDLTDLEHLAELIHAESGERGRGLTAGTALAILDSLGETPEDEVATDTAQRRIESDADAVQIMTIHGSKGLQFPFVLLPTLWSGGNRVKAIPPYTFYDHELEQRVLDVSSKEQNPSGKNPKNPAALAPHASEQSKVQNCGDQHRLTYVALTRAVHQSVVWWTPVGSSPIQTKTAKRPKISGALTGLGRLLFGAAGTSAGQLSPIPDPDATIETLTDRVSALGAADHISVTEIKRPSDLGTLESLASDETTTDPGALTISLLGDGLDRVGKVWSFSSLSGGLHADLPEFDAGDVTTEFSDDLGANDEPSFHHLGGGKDFGNLIHHILEQLDFRADDLPAAVAEVMSHPSGYRITDLQREHLPEALAQVVRTPLGSPFHELRLADLDPRDRLNELSFHLPLASRRPLAGQGIGTLIAEHLETDHPLRSWATDLATGLAPLRLQGFLTGSIDLTLRQQVDGQTRYSVLDYKTNNLTLGVPNPALRHYCSARLVQAMAASQYAFQALIYSVALHRYLRLRLPGYTPASHLGPVGYLFVRGMVGADTPIERHTDGTTTPTGVFAWNIPPALIEDLSAHFASAAAEEGDVA